MKTYFLQTKRLMFAHWQANDLELATTLWGNPAVTRYINAAGPMTPAEIQQRLTTEINNQQSFQLQYYPFYELKTARFIGVCGFRPASESGVAEFGFHLLPDFWHQGIATEAALAVLTYGFQNLKLTKIIAGHNPNNLASKKLLNKLGFQYIGTEFYAPTGLQHPTYQLTHLPKRQ